MEERRINSIKLSPETVEALRAERERRLNMTFDDYLQEAKERRQRAIRQRAEQDFAEMDEAWKNFWAELWNLLMSPLRRFRKH